MHPESTSFIAQLGGLAFMRKRNRRQVEGWAVIQHVVFGYSLIKK